MFTARTVLKSGKLCGCESIAFSIPFAELKAETSIGLVIALLVVCFVVAFFLKGEMSHNIQLDS